MAFRRKTSTSPRPRNVYRRFLYLDDEEVLNSLSALEGGEVQQAMQRVLDAGVAKAGFGIGAGPVKAELGGERKRELEHSVTVRQTVHAAVTRLLSALDEEGELFQLDALDDWGAIEENLLVEFRGDVSLCASAARPSHEEGRSAWQSLRRRLRGGAGDGGRSDLAEARIRDLCVAVAHVRPAQPYPLLLNLQSCYLLCPPAAFSRRVTVIAQVEARPRDDEVVVLRGSERGTEAAIGSRRGPELAIGEAAILKPLCVYRASDARHDVDERRS